MCDFTRQVPKYIYLNLWTYQNVIQIYYLVYRLIKTEKGVKNQTKNGHKLIKNWKYKIKIDSLINKFQYSGCVIKAIKIPRKKS